MLRIKDWHKNFETERTATFKRRQQIDFSTDINGMALVWLLNNHENGPIHFAVWILICEWYASTTPPREGWITHNGKETGVPLEAKDLASIIHVSENHVEEALKRLSQPPINWITVERSVVRSAAQSMRSGQAASLIPSYPTPTNPNRLFDKFWKAWPKKVDKAKCQQWWDRNKPDEELVDLMIQNIEAMRETPQWEDKQYIPGPYKWLYGKRWEDELPTDDRFLTYDQMFVEINKGVLSQNDYEMIPQKEGNPLWKLKNC